MDRVADRLDDLRRRLVLLADDLADGQAALAWRGMARERFAHHLARRLADLSMVAAALATAADELEQSRELP